MAQAVRIAVAVGYLGRGYSGSQVQPDVPTVQGELDCLLYTSPSPRDAHESRMPSSA